LKWLLGEGKSVKFSDRFFMENFTLDPKKQQFLRGGKTTASLEVGGSLPLEEHFVRGKSKMIATLKDRYA
jgi:hypothetical protein